MIWDDSEENFVKTFRQRATCIKRLFWPPMRQKMKFAFHQTILISLLEQWPKCISLKISLFYAYFVGHFCYHSNDEI